MITPDRYQKIRQVFLGAFDLNPGQQENYLAEHCGDDDELRAEVERLLAEKTENGTDLLKPSVPQGLMDELSEQLVGQTIGRYRIMRVIESGGMGTVYEAMQDVPERAVAVKVIKAGIATEELLRRFDHEAQVLGRLHHPGIAQIYEAGAFDLGSGRQPFFAMELIEGKPLLDHVRDTELGTRQRLELMSKTCHAVQHAHQKGVIHRDLKPGNILVDEHDQPKILDFGVARTTDADIRTTTVRTGLGRFIGTVAYMSPEQAAGDLDAIDVRSDVYALGVICYEMLAGRLPYELDRKMIHEAVRVIREDDPTPLSSTNRTFRGDLETIITKALEKEKDLRYQSVAEFAADIERYLRHEPIVARPPSTWYQARKFAQRNRALVIGAAAVAGVLIAGVIVSTTMYAQAESARQETAAERDRALQAEAMAEEQRRIAEQNERRAVEQRARAEDEAERARLAEAEAEQRAEELEQVIEFQKSQLAEVDPAMMGINLRMDILDKRRAVLEGRDLDHEVIAEKINEFESSLAGVNFTDVALAALDQNIFDEALAAIDEQFEEQPLIQARLLQTLAATLRDLGMLERAMSPQERALNIRRRALGDSHPDTLSSLDEMGWLHWSQGKLREAEPLWREALDLRSQVLGEDHVDTITSIGHLGVLLYSLGQFDMAEPYFRQALALRQRVQGPDHHDTIGATNNLGHLLQHQGNLDEAEPYLRRALEGYRRVLGDEHPHTLAAIENVGMLLRHQDQYNVAEPYLREAVDTSRRILGEHHAGTLRTIGNLGLLLMDMGDLDQAESYLREAMEGYRVTLGVDHQDTLLAMSNVAALLRDRKELEEAEKIAAEAVMHARRVFPEGHWNLGVFLNQHALTLVAMERFKEAESAMIEAHEVYIAAFGVEHARTISLARNLDFLYRKWHEVDPEAGYDAKADEWRATLPESDEATEYSIAEVDDT